MDRTAWIAVVVCAVALVLWEVYTVKQTQQNRLQPLPAAVALGTAAPSPSSGPLVSPSSGVPAAAASPTGTTAASFPETFETLRNGDVELRVTTRGGGIANAVLLHHVAEDNKPVVLNSSDHPPIGVIVENPAAPVFPEYKISKTGEAVQMEYTTPEQVSIRKKLFFPAPEAKDNFVAELDIDFVNNGPSSYGKDGYYLTLGAAEPIHRKDWVPYLRLAWSIDGKAHDKSVGYFDASSGMFGLGQKPAQPFFEQNIAGIQWGSVTSQFFATLIAPLDGRADRVWGRKFDVTQWTDQKAGGIEGAIHLPGFELAAGRTMTARFELYLGPKIYHRLATLEHSEAEIMNFGMFKWISQFLLNFMNWLHRWLWHSYAAAILALTTMIRIVLWPLQSTANKSMRQTALLGPKMQELREKYKDDPTRMNQEVMKMYKQYGINPVSGCLPMVIQIPIFFGLYQMLGQAVELRNQHFLWVHDLSQADTVGHLPVLGWPINVLPLLMAVTQLWLMQLTPKTGDPTQRRMMMFMPLIFVYFCYNFAAALALYYTAQNLFSILQLYQNRRQPTPTLEKVPAGKGKR